MGLGFVRIITILEIEIQGYELIRGTLACTGIEKDIKSYTPAAGIGLIVINGQILANTSDRAYIVSYVNSDEQNVLLADIQSAKYNGNGTASIHEFNGKQSLRFAGFAANGINMRYNIGLICMKKA